ncbi:MAG: hypothetical protein EHM24_20640 [Acidobacteria bacterium]|nr:MAG: hypothetical protein EHM24_20640 [Acidobacteriota bacterium]
MTIFAGGTPPAERNTMTAANVAGFEIHSEARGPHWVAWISKPGEPGPHRSILLVGASKDEAEAKAREWASRTAEDQAGRPLSS